MQGSYSILELRKEKSRDAARSRRGKENYEFYELAKLLPLPPAITSQLDKASIIRLSISYLKLRDFSSHGDPPWNRDGPPPNKSLQGGPNRRRSVASVAREIFEIHQGTHILQSLDGFAFALSSDGRFLYISETVSIYLGLSQVEMTGSNVFDYIHAQDHAEVAEQLGLCLPQSSSSSSAEDGSATSSPGAFMSPGPGRSFERSFCVRMKSTLTKRGVHVKCSGYRVIQMLVHMRPQFSFSLTRKHPPPLLGLVGLAIALPPPTIHEILIDNDVFVTRLSPELKVLYCEQRISDLMDVSAEDLTNQSLYNYCHAEDLQKLRKSHTDLLNKGQVLTDYYRLMNKHGGYVWVQTCATIICNVKNQEEQNIIAINYVLSGIEYGGCVMDTNQMKYGSRAEPDASDNSESDTTSETGEKGEEERKSPATRGSAAEGARTLGHLKRKHTASPDDSEYDPSSLEPRSVSLNGKDDSSLDGYSDEFGIRAGEKRDLKNSRRKMDKPRKRSRVDSGSDLEMHGNAQDKDMDLGRVNGLEGVLGEDTDLDTHNGTAVDLTSVSTQRRGEHTLMTARSPQEALALVKSPAPEDLSVRSSQVSVVRSPGSQNIPNTATSQSEKWPMDLNNTGVCQSNGTSNSVRVLEEVMNKHLPSLSNTEDQTRSGYTGEFDANNLNQSSMGYQQKHRSTIQWIGSQHPSHDVLPATNLLRTLYANRESVIRSSSVYNPRPQVYTEGGVQANLLTPPGSDHSQGTTAKSPPASVAYQTNPLSVSMATVPNETYNMTPPSSVSPHEKYPLSYGDQSYSTDGIPGGLRQCGAEMSSTHPIPIKPQAYPLPAHTTGHLAMYGRTGMQYGGTDYYGATHFTGYPTLSSNHTSYSEAQKNGTW